MPTDIIELYEEEFLRQPNSDDLAVIEASNSKRGFPGMIGSVDCMHFSWKKCPVAYQGQYKGKEPWPTVVLEAVATEDLRIWHFFFGLPGSLNDINILDRSPLLDRIMHGTAPQLKYVIAGKERVGPGYWLADGIYPDWAVFVKTLTQPTGEKRKFYAARQEAVRKDVERTFGALQQRWHFLTVPCRRWDLMDIQLVVKALIILHNMIIEDERNENNEGKKYLSDPPLLSFFLHGGCPKEATSAVLRKYSDNLAAAKSSKQHYELRNDLIDHLWEWKGHLCEWKGN
jgi:hypothetical protein